MGDKKDIGQYFKDKLKGLKKSPKEGLWDKISQSLDEVDRRKKSNKLHWFAIIGGSILIGSLLFFYFINVEKKDKQDPKTHQLTETLISPSEEILNEQVIQITNHDSLENIDNLREEILKTKLLTEHSLENPLSESSEKFSKINKKTTTTKSAEIDENYKVTKKYHYYNSENNENWITADKNRIDSLVSQETEKSDSTAIKSRESLVD